MDNIRIWIRLRFWNRDAIYELGSRVIRIKPVFQTTLRIGSVIPRKMKLAVDSIVCCRIIAVDI